MSAPARLSARTGHGLGAGMRRQKRIVLACIPVSAAAASGPAAAREDAPTFSTAGAEREALAQTAQKERVAAAIAKAKAARAERKSRSSSAPPRERRVKPAQRKKAQRLSSPPSAWEEERDGESPQLHPRNRHSHYDLESLATLHPPLHPHVQPSPHRGLTVDFSDSAAVKELNLALFKDYIGAECEIELPSSALVPAIPGRADYLHVIADLLAEDAEDGEVPMGAGVCGCDIGVGASAVYPLLARAIYGWSFVGTECSEESFAAAVANVRSAGASADVALRMQSSPESALEGAVSSRERVAFVMCNPPFFDSAKAAEAQARRRMKNVHRRANAHTTGAFGGRSAELFCAGGEGAFVVNLIRESARRPLQSVWFTALVASASNLPRMRQALASAGAVAVRELPLATGHKRVRVLAWSFYGARERSVELRRRIAAEGRVTEGTFWAVEDEEGDFYAGDGEAAGARYVDDSRQEHWE
mmetsp:Transcript_18112/g.59169  ORF Transcript_18112/g.59169 Transcript_18112/m.59169 type:complete len:475 (+) Transcript_18112:77-1501(+)